ncbi:MAG TPA: pentapeptide repeat-containing protein [Terriglobia bacterium]|jgi:uncharacterized protein YjbI with pentapeptide repeats|nr:pentapeptide repeat-containing protein [Terriglobia bacterium]
MSDCTLSGNPPYDCSGCDLTGRNLGGKDLTNAKFQGATLTGTIFRGAKSLAGTDFSGCDLSAAIFDPSPQFSLDPSHPTKFIGATIPFATLGKVWNNLDLTNADITGIPDDLSQLQASGAVLPGFHFAGRNLNNAHFIGSKLMGAHFCGAKLNNAVFTGLTDLTGAKFHKCPLSFAVFDTATLTRVDFTDAVMNVVSLLQTRMDGTVFDGVDVTSCSFSQPPRFSSDPSNLTSFRRATLNYSTILKTWTCLDLTGATLVGLDKTVDLTFLQAQYTKLGALDLSGFELTSCDFTGATLSGTKFIGAKLGLACFDGATGPATCFDGPATFLKNATFRPNPANSDPAVFHKAIFNNANLTNASFKGADLTDAQLIQASLHGATLINTTLKNANLTGAQLGSLSQLFTLETSFEHDLNAGPSVDAVLRGQFSQHGITLSESAKLTNPDPNRVWQLNDEGNNLTYTIRLETKSDNTQVLTVCAPAVSASLEHAYMPDAVLTGANLYGVHANGAQFYGSKARLDGSAILEGVEFNDANLSNVNLTQANLFGANLSGSHLFNAKFNKANLTPSADGIAANLSDANLQGADFTDAQLYGADLSNAAVAVTVRTNPNQGGVYLFSLPYPGDTNTLQQYRAELNAAASKFSLNPDGDQAKLQLYVSALKDNKLDPLKPAFLKQSIKLSDSAQIQTVEVGDIWQVVDQPTTYTLWTGKDKNDKTELYAAPSLTKTQAAFQQNGMTLRWQASAAVDTAGQLWLLDNDSQSQQIFTGYVKFIVKLNGSVLDVYGTAVRIERLGDNNQSQMDTEPCNLTKIFRTNMNSQTICPNGTALGVNQQGGKTWDELWLRAATPPRPPTCVPTDYSWCPQTQTTNQPLNRGKQRRNENG